MALDDLIGETSVNNSLVIPPGLTPGQTLLPTLPPGMESPSIGMGFPGGPELFPNQIDQLPDQYTKAMPLPYIPPGGGIHSIMPVRPGVERPILRPLPSPPVNNMPGPIFGLRPRLPEMPDYSSQFEKFGEQLTGFGDQMTGYQDALGSFNEQVGGMGKQFETISNRLDSVDKGLGSLGNQIASLENMQKAQPQQVMQPQQQSYNPFGFGGFGGFGGLGSLFGRRY